MTARSQTRIANPAVAAVFAQYPDKLRQRLLSLRGLILETAKETPRVGKLEETLKWNEPAYLTSESKSGSTIRIHRKPNSDTRYSMYFNCNTNLVDSFRTLFPTTFRYQGDREIEFDVAAKVPVEELKICIAMALTYHRNKK
jgi:Domain of unknown function (DU1801)